MMAGTGSCPAVSDDQSGNLISEQESGWPVRRGRPRSWSGPAAPGNDADASTEQVDALRLGVLRGVEWAAQVALGLAPGFSVGGVEPGQEYPYAWDGPRGTTAPAAVCAAVNMSLAPPGDHLLESRPDDAVNHATRYLSRWAVPVLPAGNNHFPDAAFETVSPWAEPEWVLCVGATSDPAGEREWPHSARGSEGRPDVMPDVLAWGQDGLDEKGFGMSFAAASGTGKGDGRSGRGRRVHAAQAGDRSPARPGRGRSWQSRDHR